MKKDSLNLYEYATGKYTGSVVLAKELIPVAILFASEAATFVTGQTIAVDGGFLASGVNSYA